MRWHRIYDALFPVWSPATSRSTVFAQSTLTAHLKYAASVHSYHDWISCFPLLSAKVA